MAEGTRIHRLIMAHQFAKALCDAGIIDFDVNTVSRIVIDAKSGEPVMMYLERFADDRWLDVALALDGIEVRTSPQEA